MTKNRADADDLPEETWLRLVSGSKGSTARTRIRPWLFTVARNPFLSYYRSRTRKQTRTRDLILHWPAGFSRSPYLEAALADVPPVY